jgi:hypothetical protein
MSDIEELAARLAKVEAEREQIAELQLAVSELREFGAIKDKAVQALDKLNSDQNKRMRVLRDVIQYAVNQYGSMRDDALEDEITRDQGVPMWLSVVFSAGITIFPISAVTTAFLGELADGTKRMLTASTRSRLKNDKIRMGRQKAKLTRRQRQQRYQDREALRAEIKDVEELITTLAKNWDPELSNFLQNIADQLSQALGKQFFELLSGRSDSLQDNRFERTDAPPVVVQQGLNQWIEAVEGAVAKEYNEQHREILMLHGAATAQTKAPSRKATPAEKSQARKQADEKRKAKEKLKSFAEELAADPPEAEKEITYKDLRDLQLIVEMMIWCSTYNFAPNIRHGEKGRLRGGERIPYSVVEPIPLPGNLWKRLTERYAPLLPPWYAAAAAIGWSSELALSMFFSDKLFPELNRENSVAVRRLQALMLGPKPKQP